MLELHAGAIKLLERFVVLPMVRILMMELKQHLILFTMFRDKNAQRHLLLEFESSNYLLPKLLQDLLQLQVNKLVPRMELK